VVGREGEADPAPWNQAIKLTGGFAPKVVFVASGMTLFIGLVARYDIGGPLRGHLMSGARPLKRLTPDATLSNQAYMQYGCDENIAKQQNPPTESVVIQIKVQQFKSSTV
jgi:hypothetical protein